MQAPAQGLGQLMQQRQAAPQQAQQPQMPSPQSGGPMAGLGSVEDRVAAYRGNPAPLQQRYAMSQDLLDLLALQKIKSEKENAARQMQMQMAQQQAAQGGEPPTVAQQRENEVRDLTKRELAQQVGGVNSQQFQAQQQGMQKLMQGIARAPGAQAAAQPKMMATGGIVAFGAGGRIPHPPPKYLPGMYSRPGEDRRVNPAYTKWAEKYSEEDYRAQMEEDKKARLGTVMPRTQAEDLPEYMKPPAPRTQAAPEPAAPYQDEALRRMRAGPVSAPAPAEKAPAPYQDEALRRMRANAAPSGAPPQPREQQAGLPTLRLPDVPKPQVPGPVDVPPPAAVPGPVKMPEMSPEYKQAMNLSQQYAQAGAPDAARKSALAEESRVEGLMGLRPEERAILDKNTAELEGMRMTPEQMRKRGLIDFMTGAGGRRYNVLGGASKYASGQEQQRVKGQMDLLKDIQTSRLKPIDVRRDATKEGIMSGRELGKTLGQQGIQGLSGLRGLAGDERTRQVTSLENAAERQGTAAREYAGRVFTARSDAASREATASAKQLDAQVAMLEAQTQQAANMAIRENSNVTALMGRLDMATKNRSQAIELVDKKYKQSLDMINLQLQAKPKDEALLAERQRILAARDAEVAERLAPFDENLDRIEAELAKFGRGTGTGYTVNRK